MTNSPKTWLIVAATSLVATGALLGGCEPREPSSESKESNEQDAGKDPEPAAPEQTSAEPEQTSNTNSPGDFQLAAPTGTLPSRNVTVTWTASSDADDMSITLSSNAGCDPATHSLTVDADQRQVTFAGVTNGTYFVCAVARNANGEKSATAPLFNVGSVVVGKPDFTTTSCTISASCTSEVLNAVYVNGRLIATDGVNNRVLIWNQLPTSNGQPADLVLGQPDFSSNTANRGGSVTGSTLDAPLGVASDGTRLVIADAANNRLLIWHTFPVTNGEAADLVLGQSTMTDTGGLNEYSLSLPYGPVIHDGKLVASDTGFNRIQIWNTFPTNNGELPDIIVGQPDIWSTANGTAAGMLDTPTCVTVVNGDLWVTEAGNHRLVRFHPFPTTSFGSADIVIGQPNMNSASAGTTATSLNGPHCSGSADGKMFVADFDNNRILVWNEVPTSNHAPADSVIGQSNLTSSLVVAASENTLKQPTSVNIANGTMVIADWGNKRIVLRPYP